jgi:uncharacterized repeat protein (TIGR02543 family)
MNLRKRLLMFILTFALVFTGVFSIGFSNPLTVSAVTDGDEGGYRDEYYNQSDNADATKVEWNGKTWDIIGYNYDGIKHGIASDTVDTATLLLDKSSYFSGLSTEVNSPYSYLESTLQTKTETLLSSFEEDLGSIVKRDIEGGVVSIPNDRQGYTGNNVSGTSVTDQSLWVLSVSEASQLKASVRSFDGGWWLRSTGFYSNGYCAASVNNYGSVQAYGHTGTSTFRPALYLDLSSSIFSAIDFSASNINIGAYDETPKVTDAEGYTWDVVGVNDAVSKGIATPEGNATLLLSIQSVEKFAFDTETSINGKYDERDSLVASSNYSTSSIKTIMESAYDSIKSNSEYDGKIMERSFDGGAVYNDESEAVAGSAVANQGLWPLSFAEAKTLTNQERIFGCDWWLRSPGYDSGMAVYIYGNGQVFPGTGNGQVYPNYGSHVGDSLALRPALYLDLTSTIFTSLNSSDPNWQEKVGASTTYTVTFNSKGGSSVESRFIRDGYAIGTLPVPTRTNYTFSGWWTEETEGAQIDALTLVSENVTYYAHWTEVIPKATFINISGGNSISTQGGTLQLTAAVLPSGADQEVSWKVDDADIAEISSTGKVTAKANGIVKVTAKATDGSNVKAEFNVTITGQTAVIPKATSINISGGNSISTLGGTLQLSATVLPANAEQEVNWKVDDTDIAEISSTGKVTAKANGIVKVTAKATDGSNVKAELNVTITGQTVIIPKATSINISGGNSISTKDGTLQLSAAVSPYNAKQEVNWSVSDANIAAVSSTGLVTAKGDGNVKVTATATDGSGVTSETTISITGQTAVIPKATSINISGGNSISTKGGTLQLTAAVLPSNADQGIEWTVDGIGLATVDSTGKVTAIADGNVKVTATTTDGSGVTGETTISITGQTVKEESSESTPIDKVTAPIKSYAEKLADTKEPVPPIAIVAAPKVKAGGAKSVIVTIPKTKGATSYIIRYKTGKSKWKSVTVKGNNPKFKKITKLKKGKKYTFQIRSVKKVGNKTYKAKWSKARSVKVK